jgi:hypothetical protein
VTGSRAQWRAARQIIACIYGAPAGSAGCCLHVVTDDRNYDDAAADVCVRQAEAAGHPGCQAAARFLRRLTPAERRTFLRVRR